MAVPPLVSPCPLLWLVTAPYLLLLLGLEGARLYKGPLMVLSLGVILTLKGLGYLEKGFALPKRCQNPKNRGTLQLRQEMQTQLVGPPLAPTGELQWDQPPSSALRARSLPLPDSPGAEDQRRQERQQVVSGAESHAVHCLRGTFFLRWLCSPSFPRSCLSLVPGFVPSQREKPSPAASRGRQTDRRTDASPRQALEVGSIFGSDVTSGEWSPARDCVR